MALVQDGLVTPVESQVSGRRRLIAPVLAIIAVVAFVLMEAPSLGQPLLEAHSFRQTQTAFTALIFHESGIDLLHPQLPVLGAPWEVPFEFPLFQAIASIVMDAGLAPDTAMRVTAIAAFAVAALLTWQLTARIAGLGAAFAALVAFLLTPFAVLWSRASLVEYLAVAASIAYVLAAFRWHEDRRRAMYAVALVAGVISFQVKITTGIVYLLPILAMPIAFGHLRQRPWSSQAGYLVAVGILLAVPLGLGVLWTRHADLIKATSEFTSLLTSDALFTWNFGTLDQKLSLTDWAGFVGSWSGLLFGGALVVWVPLALLGAYETRRRSVALALVAAAWIGPLVFTNLYFVHDYYLAAVTPLAAISVGLAARWLWLRRRNRVIQVAALILVGLWVVQAIRSFDYWSVGFRGTVDVEDALVAARQIAEGSAPDEPVVVTGREWSPAALYYARRRGLMFFGSPELSLAAALAPESVAKLRALGYRQVFHCPWKSPEGCTRVIDLDAVPEDLDLTTPVAATEAVTQEIPAFVAGRQLGLDGGVCNIDGIDAGFWPSDAVDVRGRSSIEIRGWAVDGSGPRLPRGVVIRFQDAAGHVYYAPTSPQSRPDVGDYLGDPTLSDAGLKAVVSVPSLPAGEYEVMFVIDTAAGPVLCAPGRRLRA